MKQALPWLLGTFVGLALVTLFPASLTADDCDDPKKFMRANPAAKPLYLRWAQGESIPLGWADSGMPDILKNIVDAAKTEWQSISGGRYSFTSGTNVTEFTSGTWSRPHDLAYTYVTPPTAGSPYITSVAVEFDATRVDWHVSESACPGTLDLYDFYSAAVHEVGHVLGLADVSCSGDVMHTPLNNRECRRYTDDPDENAIAYLYSCEGCGRMIVAGLTDCEDDECTPDNPVARVVGFNFVNGWAVWETLEEIGTAHYVVEGCNTPNGIGLGDLATEPAGVGPHKVEVEPGSFDMVRLVEVEESGSRFVRGIALATNFSSARASRLYPDELVPAAPTAGQTLSGSPSVVPPTLVIYATTALHGPVWDNLLWFWSDLFYEQGEDGTVELVEIPDDPPGVLTPQEWIKADIAARHSSDATRRFHFVGDWRNDYSAETAVSSNDVNGVTSEFIHSDQWYADVDDDSIPDVVVTRWPASNSSEVITMAANHRLYMNGLAESVAPDHATFLVGDVNEQQGSGELARWMSEQVEAQVPVASPYNPGGLSISRVLKTSFPDVDDRNAETAEILNEHHPDLVSILSTNSEERAPGTFFATQELLEPIQNPWTMTMLESGWFIRMVIAASCGGGAWQPNDDPGAQPPAICDRFFTSYDRGAISWIGPKPGSAVNGSLQDANYVISLYVVRELARNPYQPMSEAWLRAMRDAYVLFADSPEFLTALRGYSFLGDPVSPFSRLPQVDISASIHRGGTGVIVPMTGSYAVTCPQGDGDTLSVEVRFEPQHMIGPLSASSLTLSQPVNHLVRFVTENPKIQADSPTIYVGPVPGVHDDYYTTRFTIPSSSGCGVDSALVSLHGIPLGYAHFNVRSVDFDPDTKALSHGKVNLPDFSFFGGKYTSSVCDCGVHPKQFHSCANFAMPDTVVNLVDASKFGSHWQHEAPGGTVALATDPVSSQGEALLEFEEIHPLIGEHRLRATISLEGVEPFEVAALVLRNDNPRLEFIGWSEASTYGGETICTETTRDGHNEIFLGVLGSVATPSELVLGTAEFRVLSSEQLVLSDDDLALVAADLLPVGNRRQVAISSIAVHRALTPPRYENALAQNYPNPFNPSTTIAFSLERDSDVSLLIYDVRGALVRDLVRGRREKGVHRISWDGMNGSGQDVASGVYFYKLVAGTFTDTKKMTLLK